MSAAARVIDSLDIGPLPFCIALIQRRNGLAGFRRHGKLLPIPIIVGPHGRWQSVSAGLSRRPPGRCAPRPAPGSRSADARRQDSAQTRRRSTARRARGIGSPRIGSSRRGHTNCLFMVLNQWVARNWVRLVISCSFSSLPPWPPARRRDGRVARPPRLGGARGAAAAGPQARLRSSRSVWGTGMEPMPSATISRHSRFCGMIGGTGIVLGSGVASAMGFSSALPVTSPRRKKPL